MICLNHVLTCVKICTKEELSTKKEKKKKKTLLIRKKEKVTHA